MDLKKDFYWGNSVSSMQTEGAYNSYGKGPSTYDLRVATESASDWKVATDSYHRFREDFDLMEDLGMNMYRFQISWSRVNPTGDGEWNEEGIAFYDTFIDELIDRGIEPMICLYHFDMPNRLSEKYDGFLSKHVVEAFKNYGIEMVKRFGHKVKHWITFNEQNLYHVNTAYIKAGALSEQTVDGLYQIQHNVTLAHAYVANYIHEYTDCKISGMVAYSEVYPATSHPMDIHVARVWDEFANHNTINVFVNGEYGSNFLHYVQSQGIDMNVLDGEMEEISKVRSDYLTFSYYASSTIDHRLIPKNTIPNEYLKYGKKDNPYLETTEWNWQIDPMGFRDILNKLYSRYKLPVFPIENGIGVRERWNGKDIIQDQYRIDYMSDHIKAMKDAIFLDGVDVMGYLGWGLIDILSSQGDMEKRYGVVYVNRSNHDLMDLKRVPKLSYNWLKETIRSNASNIK